MAAGTSELVGFGAIDPDAAATSFLLGTMAKKMPSWTRSCAPRFDFGSRATRGSSIASSDSFAGSGSRSFRFPSESGWWKMRCTESASKRTGEKTWPADEVRARHACECPRADGARQSSIHRRLFHELFPPGNGDHRFSRPQRLGASCWSMTNTISSGSIFLRAISPTSSRSFVTWTFPAT